MPTIFTNISTDKSPPPRPPNLQHRSPRLTPSSKCSSIISNWRVPILWDNHSRQYLRDTGRSQRSRCISMDGLQWWRGYSHPAAVIQWISFWFINWSNARIVGVTYDGIEGYGGLDDFFCPEVNRRAIEAALRKAQDEGITVCALLVSKLVLSSSLAAQSMN